MSRLGRRSSFTSIDDRSYGCTKPPPRGHIDIDFFFARRRQKKRGNQSLRVSCIHDKQEVVHHSVCWKFCVAARDHGYSKGIAPAKRRQGSDMAFLSLPKNREETRERGRLSRILNSKLPYRNAFSGLPCSSSPIHPRAVRLQKQT